MTHERIAFTGPQAAIGLLVLGVFELFGVLGLAGGVVLVASGEVAWSRDLGLGLALLAGFVGWFGWTIVRSLRLFRVIDQEPDGSWTLRNALGVALALLPAGAARTINELRAETWMFTGGARKYTQAWFEITSNGRTYRSTRTTPSGLNAARAALARWQSNHHT